MTDFLGIGGRDSVEFLAASMRAMAQLHEGELAESARAFEAALDMPAAQYRLWRVFALGGHALALALAGRSTEARAHASAALAFAEANGIANHHGLAYSHFALARVSLDERDRYAATYHLHETETRVRRSGRAALRSLQELLRIEHLATSIGPQSNAGRGADLGPSAVRAGAVRRATAGPGASAAGARPANSARPGRWSKPSGPPRSVMAAVIDLELASGDSRGRPARPRRLGSPTGAARSGRATARYRGRAQRGRPTRAS